MNLSTTVLFFFTDLICPMIVGYGLRRRDLFNAEAVDRLIVFSILAFEPILGFLSFWRLHLDVRLAWLPILGAVMNVTPSILAFVRARYKYRDPLAQGGYVLATMLSNRGVVGTLTVFAIYGEIGYAVVTLLLLSSAPFLYSVGYAVAERFQRQHDRCRLPERAHRTRFFTWKQLPLLGLALGAVLNLGGVPRPAVAGELFPYLVHGSAWLSVVPVGYALEFTKIRAYWRQSLDLLWIKFILTPIVTYLLLMPLHLDHIAFNVALILAFAPTAINAVVTARLFRLNIHITTTAFVLTTVAYLGIVLPCLLWWYR